jgi:hypothetical protein
MQQYVLKIKLYIFAFLPSFNVTLRLRWQRQFVILTRQTVIEIGVARYKGSSSSRLIDFAGLAAALCY